MRALKNCCPVQNNESRWRALRTRRRFLYFYLRGKRKQFQELENRSKKRKFCVRDIFLQRTQFGLFNTLYQELKHDREYYYRYLRMSPERFSHFLSLVQDRIAKRDTKFRKSISAEERLILTLRFLASGETQQSLSFSFRVGRKSVSQIVVETSEAIYLALKDTYLNTPETADQWKKISDKFENVWNFPHVLGAIDGKHIRIESPKNGGTLYHNYKGFFSLVLLVVCDADYCFTMFDVGEYGSNNDSGILANSIMGKRFERETIVLPEPTDLPGCNFSPLPYYLLGDEIFPLKHWLIRPFPGKSMTEEHRIYNYRHSRARRVIENTFGILTARWRIFSTFIKVAVVGPLKAEATTSSGPTFLLLTEPDVNSPYGLLSTLNPILIRKHFGFSETTPDEQIGRQCYQGMYLYVTSGWNKYLLYLLTIELVNSRDMWCWGC